MTEPLCEWQVLEGYPGDLSRAITQCPHRSQGGNLVTGLVFACSHRDRLNGGTCPNQVVQNARTPKEAEPSSSIWSD